MHVVSEWGELVWTRVRFLNIMFQDLQTTHDCTNDAQAEGTTWFHILHFICLLPVEIMFWNGFGPKPFCAHSVPSAKGSRNQSRQYSQLLPAYQALEGSHSFLMVVSSQKVKPKICGVWE